MFLNLSFGTLNLRFRKRILRNKQLQNARKHVSHCVLQKTNMDYQRKPTLSYQLVER